MPKKTLLLLMGLSCLWGATQQKDKDLVWAFKFQDYPVTDVFKSKPAAAILTTEGQRQFRTMIKQGAAKGPNFAGHYAVAQWGCGSSCLQLAVVDSVTGHVYDAPFATLITGSQDHVFRGLVFHLQSRLFVADGCPNEDETKCGTYYYEWKDNEFKLLRLDPQPQENK